MAGWTGLEPAASGVTGRRYNRLNYHPVPFRTVLPCEGSRLLLAVPQGVKLFLTRGSLFVQRPLNVRGAFGFATNDCIPARWSSVAKHSANAWISSSRATASGTFSPA